MLRTRGRKDPKVLAGSGYAGKVRIRLQVRDGYSAKTCFVSKWTVQLMNQNTPVSHLRLVFYARNLVII